MYFFQYRALLAVLCIIRINIYYVFIMYSVLLFPVFTAAMCCSRPERQHSLRDVGLRRERIGALGDRRVAGCFRQEPAMTQRRARQQGARELPATFPASNTLLFSHTQGKRT